MTDLGTHDNSRRNSSYAMAINDSGEVVGGSFGHAFLYSGGVMQDLGAGEALAINNDGAIFGRSFLAGGVNHAFLYRDGAMTDLGTLGGSNSYGRAINAFGDVAGPVDSKPFILIRTNSSV